MKIFTNKNLMQKLIIAIVCVVILLNFCITPRVQAGVGGKMMGFMRDFATGITDIVASLVQFGLTGQWIWAVDDKGTGNTDGTNNYWIKNSKFQYPILQISPELIFAGEIELLDANFISPDNSKKYSIELNEDTALQKLRDIIAGWYVTLRTIAVVGLLSVLIYIGIRIIISSTSADKAKYKERIMDWVIAFCLLFFMHYIMAGTLTVVEKVNEVLAHNAHVYDGLEIPSEFGTVRYGVTSTENSDTGVDTNELGYALTTVRTTIPEKIKVKARRDRVQFEAS